MEVILIYIENEKEVINVAEIQDIMESHFNHNGRLFVRYPAPIKETANMQVFVSGNIRMELYNKIPLLVKNYLKNIRASEAKAWE